MDRPSLGLTLWIAAGLVLTIEGLLYAFFAPRVPLVAVQVARMPPALIRRMGVTVAMIGLLLLWWAKNRL